MSDKFFYKYLGPGGTDFGVIKFPNISYKYFVPHGTGLCRINFFYKYFVPNGTGLCRVNFLQIFWALVGPIWDSLNSRTYPTNISSLTGRVYVG